MAERSDQAPDAQQSAWGIEDYIRYMAVAPYRCQEDIQMLAWLSQQADYVDTAKQMYAEYVEPEDKRRLLGNCVRVSAAQLPELWSIHCKCCARLGNIEAELYVEGANVLQASAMGVGPYRVSLTSVLVDSFSPEELAFVIGHEIAHASCDHGLYQSTQHLVVQHLEEKANQAYEGAGSNAGFAENAFRVGGVIGIGAGMLGALSSAAQGARGNAYVRQMQQLVETCQQWGLTAEYSADRGGLLCCGDAEVATRVMIKLAVGSPSLAAVINVQEYLQQASEVTADAGEDATHPLTVHRAHQLTEWAESAEATQLQSFSDYLAQSHSQAH